MEWNKIFNQITFIIRSAILLTEATVGMWASEGLGKGLGRGFAAYFATYFATTIVTVATGLM
ncbi:hypothetical protein B0T26DRAFT_724271 [Lasiosphaeria miniovina]|uniref:Uncharacterized protein n=1 Tax=Lasiosphaeria miniovina TaxID=1954250 RepID=A0AA40A6R1_9PEZI|nr:uncharacterized protein B0T26DRAFT_724271 [Lasiosphaeria miniovina]KAK0710176.1 hypothetical protein B0T26DRAFT_724271 [Lasiosphaeria miniovina]